MKVILLLGSLLVVVISASPKENYFPAPTTVRRAPIQVWLERLLCLPRDKEEGI